MTAKRLSKAPRVRQLSKAEAREERLNDLETSLLEASLEVVASSCEFAAIDPDEPNTIPLEWVNQFGMEGAKRKHRIALAAWKSQREAPKALDVATKIAVGIIRARATEKGGDKALRINKVVVSMPTVDQNPALQFPEIVVSDDDEIR